MTDLVIRETFIENRLRIEIFSYGGQKCCWPRVETTDLTAVRLRQQELRRPRTAK